MPERRMYAMLTSDIAVKAENLGVKKAGMDTFSTLVLAFLAGAFIALGAVFATTVTTDAGVLPYGIGKLLGGLAFCLGLILVVVGGAELFTGNNLIVMAWASGRIRTRSLARNWALVYIGNFIGAVGTALLVYLSGQYTFADGAVGQNILAIANSKAGLDFGQALVLGMMCNVLVCLAVWLTYSAEDTTDKIMAILFPITAFVAIGFEHSIANMYFIPIGLLIQWLDPAFVAAAGIDVANLTVGGFLNNLIPVTIGNIVGGALMVAGVYWFVYLRTNHSRFAINHQNGGPVDDQQD
jgi:formate transporter